MGSFALTFGALNVLASHELPPAAKSDCPFVRLDAAGANYLIAWAEAKRNSEAWYDVYYRRLAI